MTSALQPASFFLTLASNSVLNFKPSSLKSPVFKPSIKPPELVTKNVNRSLVLSYVSIEIKNFSEIASISSLSLNSEGISLGKGWLSCAAT